jgi:hypothetical protein
MRTYQAWLWGSVAAMGLALTTIKPLAIPDWAAVGLWSVWPVVLVFAVLSLTPIIRHVIAARTERPVMSTVVAILLGAIVGGVSAPIILSLLPDDEADKLAQNNGDSSDAVKSPENTAQAGAPTESEELEFYFHPFLIAAGQDNIQYSGATITNRSPRKMHLELWAHIYYWKDDGKPAGLGFRPEWNPEGLNEGTGETTIYFDAFEPKEGSLVLFLDNPEKYDVRRWNINPYNNVYIHAFDSVTGKHIAFKASPGYPDAKVPWPLPPPAKLLALQFPEVATANSLLPLDSLELLARTQFVGYQNDGRLSFTASIANLSSNRMKLQVNLLTRKSVDDNEWRTFRAVLVPLREESKNHLDYYALDFGPGDVADCSLVVANTGFTNKIGEEFDGSPRVSLFEIIDEMSRKKVWCAIEPGYPPGADMRWATIQPPPEIPGSDSDNPQKDESNDSK